MKTLNKAFYIILAFAATLGACKKDSTTSTTTTTGASATVTASGYGFDGANSGKFNSTKAGITQTTVAGLTTFTISAIIDGGNTSIGIVVLQKITTTGKITFSPTLSNGGITISKDYTKPADRTVNYTTDQNSTTVKGGGEINITKISGNSVEGTFYAVAHNSTGAEAYIEQGTFTGTIVQ
ncbi:MAG: hypothetical protein H7289_04375 [Mucilaginibacter sp.]|nr:hypothetical protein [Mucilaginibacter sp.]